MDIIFLFFHFFNKNFNLSHKQLKNKINGIHPLSCNKNSTKISYFSTYEKIEKNSNVFKYISFSSLRTYCMLKYFSIIPLYIHTNSHENNRKYHLKWSFICIYNGIMKKYFSIQYVCKEENEMYLKTFEFSLIFSYFEK